MTKDQQADDELDILMGGRYVTLSTGEQVMVREYTAFHEGMRADAIARPVLQGLQDLFQRLNEGEDFNIYDLSGVFGQYPEIIDQLLAMACDKPVEWVHGLNDRDGQAVLLNWWDANSSFFFRRLVTEGLTRAMTKRAASDRGRSLDA